MVRKLAKRKVSSRIKQTVKKAKRSVKKAKKTKSKYIKEYIEVWQCGDCDFKWAYRTIKCPICYSGSTTKII